MDLSDLGEFGLIDRIGRMMSGRLPSGVTGIGDDCAVIPAGGDRRLLVTTDMLVEGTHFILDRIAPEDLGHKSLAVNLSDIAAMGGRPEWAFISLALPAGTPLGWLKAFYSGLKRLAERTGVRLLGGDTTCSPRGLVINIAVTGIARKDRIKYRSGAHEGDIVFLTDTIGDSAAGLSLVLTGGRLDRDGRYLVRRHNRPEPCLDEGRWLAARHSVGAMMDVSDGLDSDIRRIMDRSGSGARIDLDTVPTSPAMKRKAAAGGFDARELAVAGGEDYCLLATSRPESFPRLAADFKRTFRRPLFPVGTITGPKAGLEYVRNGRPVVITGRGYDHFMSRKD